MALLSTTEPSFIEIGATTRAASRRGANYEWNDPILCELTLNLNQ